MTAPARGGPKTTASSRPGGKFGGPRRGKFANPTPPPTPGGGNGPSAPAPPDAAAAGSSKARKRRVRTERQAKLFADLDEAESLVLEMVGLASETASALSDLASGGKMGTATGDGDPSSTTDGVATKIASIARKNGDDYLEKVSKVHSLLAPHADKVVAYRNHAVDIAGESAAAGGETVVGNSGANVAAGEGASSPPAGEKLVGADGGTVGSTDASSAASKKSHNMYAARVEMRLAIERRDVMKEFLRLENISDDGGDAGGKTGKRKRDDLDLV